MRAAVACLPLEPGIGSLHACTSRPPASAFCRQGGACIVPHASHLLHLLCVFDSGVCTPVVDGCGVAGCGGL